MKQLLILLTAALVCAAPASRAADEALPAYALKVQVAPAQHRLEVEATITFPAARADRELEFLLAAPLEISASSPTVERLPAGEVAGFTGINGSSASLEKSGHAARYRVRLDAKNPVLHLRYAGPIDFGLETSAEEYARGFSETAGTIGPQGVYLGGSTLWYPYLGDTLFAASVEARAPEGWHLITVDPGSTVDDLPLVGGPLTRYARSVGAVEAEVFLREPDPALAAKYLEATARDLEMYRQLIGPYPYVKFALVENFWETGYGMPSFTLLGPQIIRFPFILTSSYPHEILHNWWGNSVYPDYATGNWSEGLTAYMADHLFKEQAGQAAEYRRDTLKRYRDYVRDEHDFPLREFRSRHSAATEAVGYGKTLMGFHMLRRHLGDDAFRAALQDFYRSHRGHRAGFADLKQAFAEASGTNLDAFFTQWVERAGAANLRLEDVRRDGANVRGTIRQLQTGEPFDLEVPLVVRSADGHEVHVVHLTQAATPFEFSVQGTPLLVELDPEFDVFRLLDPLETAPSLGQVFGDPALLAVLPAAADEATRQRYRDMLARWTSPNQAVEVKLDSEVETLPADRAVWIFGADNRFAASLLAAARAEQPALGAAGENSVFVRRNPANAEKAIGVILLGEPAATMPLAGKLPHYGKYSYLAFTGAEATNSLKGEWATSDSPLRVDLRPAGAAALPPLAMDRRAPLAELPPVFSAERMLADVNWLAAAEREGRGLGTRGIREAATWITEAFTRIGLQPGGTDGGWTQAFPRGENIIGVLPGTDPALAGQALVVSAHYDHLGPGYPGADDNASGVAVLLELARSLADGAAPARSIVFVAFSGEESGLLGSRHYAEHPLPVPLAGIRANLNLDTVGRLGDGPVRVIGAGTATEWPHIFRGIGFTTGLAIQTLEGATESSDQQAFIERGIPAVQLFSGANLDYHKPGDTPDKIDAAGMVKVATVAKEAIDYLATRVEPLHATISEAPAPADAPAAPSARRVSFGVVPDFAWSGEGVRIDALVPNSPAAASGLQAGDVLLALDDAPLASLRAFSNALRALAPGDTLAVRYRRGDEERTTEVTVTGQ